MSNSSSVETPHNDNKVIDRVERLIKKRYGLLLLATLLLGPVLGSRNSGGCVSRTLFGDGEAPWGTKRVLVVALVSTLTPLFLALVFGSEFPGTQLRHFGLSFPTVSASVIIGVAGLWALGFFKCHIFGSQKESANCLPFEAPNDTQYAPLAWSLPRTTLPA